MNIDELEQILRILKQNEVTDFELENNGVHLRLSRGPKLVSTAVSAVAAPSVEPAITIPASSAPVSNGAPAVDAFAGLHKVESPIVGTFYRRSSPDAAPYVTEGQVVKKGDTLCIIEAMKIMNEIEAPTSGRVVKSMLDDGQVVEFGEVLFVIDPRV